MNPIEDFDIYDSLFLQMDTFAGGMSSYFGGGKNDENDDDEKEPYAGNRHETLLRKTFSIISCSIIAIL